MTVFKHELRQGRSALIIWTAAISFMLGICIVIYPEMSAQMEDVSAMFADMGSFSQAFGMDRINFGEFLGFFGARFLSGVIENGGFWIFAECMGYNSYLVKLILAIFVVISNYALSKFLIFRKK